MIYLYALSKLYDKYVDQCIVSVYILSTVYYSQFVNIIICMRTLKLFNHQNMS